MGKKYFLMDYIEGETFEKFYVKNLTLFGKNDAKIKKYLRKLAKSMAEVHSTSKHTRKTDSLYGLPHKYDKYLQQEFLVPIHGDMNTENVLCNDEEVYLIDPETKSNQGLFYYDLTHFVHHMRFKIPFKYLSLTALLYGSRYEKYFLKQYIRYSKRELRDEIYYMYRYHKHIVQKMMFKQKHIFADNILQKAFKPFLIMFCTIETKIFRRKIDKVLEKNNHHD